MQGVLQQINSVPCVVGGFVCDRGGSLLAHSFPALFDVGMLRQGAAVIADGIAGIDGEGDGAAQFLEFRYSNGRIVVRPMEKGFLLLLCAKTVNLQLLSLSLNVALKKLERLFPSVVGTDAAPAPVESLRLEQYPAETERRELRRDGNGIILTIDTLKTTANTYWEQMEGSVVISRRLAIQISDFYRTGAFRKLKLTNRAVGISKIFPVTVIERDKEQVFSDRVVLTKAAAEHLKARPGDELVAEMATGTGVFGWEGI